MSSSRGQASENSQRQIFLFFILIFCLIVVILAFVLWYIPYVGLSNIHTSLPWILALLFGILVSFFVGGALTMLFTILTGRDLFFNRRLRGLVIRILLPVISLMAKPFGISKDRARQSFIEINNELVKVEAPKVKPEEILLLLPHCLQFHECEVRITGNVFNCKRCGRCKIKDLVELARTTGVQISIATGGTLARKIVVEKRPKVIIGVACERDLSSGIQDTYPIPVYGILNRRPNGPCFDTDVDLQRVQAALENFMIGQ
ncbi:MAG: DUF116 domain-containing protein [Desulfatiglandales bacterium]